MKTDKMQKQPQKCDLPDTHWQEAERYQATDEFNKKWQSMIRGVVSDLMIII